METVGLMKKSEIKLVVIDQTEFWDEDLQKACGKIETVFMYDASYVTHLCDPNPCFYLTPLYYVIRNEVSDEVQEIVDAEMSSEQATYMQCSFVDRQHHAPLDPGCDFEYEEVDDTRYKEGFEETMEYLQGNHQY